ncbi:N-methylhydantoinase A [Bordetella petrii]|uniref:N-methylhydantoinase A n=2 Tax=Bordetella petrii TaxID=94624 RepID=A9IBJ2_BORPD|nr:N-methylhydantoinase A [Bordetella petrii]
MAANGTVLKAPEPQALDALIEQLRTLGVEAVAICFINAYANDAHEREVAQWIIERLPEVYVCTGTDLTREWYEYERACTACANAFVGPQMGRYAHALEAALQAGGFSGRSFFMGSGGGAISLAQAARQPIRLVESGPVGGLVGAAAYARALGLANVVALDIGGTTAKCALIKDGGFDVSSTFWIGGYERGMPIRSSIIDIVEVGAGGGSIAFVDELGRMHVGPRSAGSRPGPVAYGRGGIEPTVTDANVVLGRIDPENFLGDGMHLDAQAIEATMHERLVQPLRRATNCRDEVNGQENDTDYDLAPLAAGVLTVSSVKMAGAIRKVTVERGEDPRDFTLLAYGGGGPLHASELAREIGIPHIVVPPRAGVFAAFGMLFADMRNDATCTFLEPLEDEVMPRLRSTCEALQEEAKAGLGDRCTELSPDISYSAELRYRGQMHSLRMPIDPAQDVATLRQRFEALYTRRFGQASPRSPAEFVVLVATASAGTPTPSLQPAVSAQRLVPDTPSSADIPVQTRHVYLGDPARWLEVPIYGSIASGVERGAG